jgi:hypothetical protein
MRSADLRQVRLGWWAPQTHRAAAGNLLDAAQALELLLAGGEDESLAAQTAAQVSVFMRSGGHNDA